MAVLNLFHIFATTVDSTAVEKNLLIMKFYNREKEIAELKRVQELAFGQNSRMIVVTGSEGNTYCIFFHWKKSREYISRRFYKNSTRDIIYFYSGWHI